MKPQSVADKAENETQHGDGGEIQDERIECGRFHRENLLMLI
jgi:hypothetical protein